MRPTILAFCLLPPLAAAGARQAAFQGKATAERPFEQRFGPYRLRVSVDDIQVRVEGEDQDLVPMATPPFHGPTPYDFQGWHFAPEPGTGQPAAASPGTQRSVSFYLRPQDAERGLAFYNSDDARFHRGTAEAAAAEAWMQAVLDSGQHPERFGQLELEIRHAELAPEEAYPGSPRILSLSFKGRIRWREEKAEPFAAFQARFRKDPTFQLERVRLPLLESGPEGKSELGYGELRELLPAPDAELRSTSASPARVELRQELEAGPRTYVFQLRAGRWLLTELHNGD